MPGENRDKVESSRSLKPVSAPTVSTDLAENRSSSEHEGTQGSQGKQSEDELIISGKVMHVTEKHQKFKISAQYKKSTSKQRL